MDNDNKNDESYCLFGAEAMLSRLDALEQEISGVIKAEDIECIHRMRVASRRLRSAFALFGACFPEKDAKKWIKQIRRITRSLGSARDLDVQIDFLKEFLSNLIEPHYAPGIKRILLRLQQQRDKLQSDVISTMQNLQSDGVLEEIKNTMKMMCNYGRLHNKEGYSQQVYNQAYREITTCFDEFLFYERYINDPSRMNEIHLMRICAKRLRYTMEVFAQIYEDELDKPIKAIKETQTLLGDFHDCFIWIESLDQFLVQEKVRTLEYFGNIRAFSRLKAGIIYLQEDKKKQQIEKHKEFLKFWENTQDKDVWGELIRYIYRHFSDKGAIL
jgi:CHAD domain-containing protein